MYDGISEVYKRPSPSRQRSCTFKQTVRGSRLAPAAASRWSKVCPIDRPHQHVRKHLRDRIPKVRRTARAIAPSLSHTLAGCARPRGRSPDTKDCAIKRCSARLRTHRFSRATTGEGRVRLACDYVGACVRAFAWSVSGSQCSEQPRLAQCALSRPHFATPISRPPPFPVPGTHTPHRHLDWALKLRCVVSHNQGF